MSPTIRHPDQRNQRRGVASPFSQNGFTLVEMLVVITVILVLMGVSLAVMNVSLEGERVRSGASQIQSYLAGARDRAAYTNRPCGVRFNSEQLPDGKTVVRSMGYIELPADWRQGSFFVYRFPLRKSEDTNNNGHLDQNEDTNNNGFLDPVIPEHSQLVTENNSTEWHLVLTAGEDVNGDGVLNPGEDLNGNGRLDAAWVNKPKIQIDNRWHTVETFFLDNFGNQRLVIRPPCLRIDGSRVLQNEYRLQLQPVIMAGQEPVLFPSGVVIDLDQCRAGHREDINGNGNLDTEDLNTNGVLDPGEDTNNNGKLDTEDLDLDGGLDQGTALALPNSWFAASGGYHPSLDILFSPNGTVFGAPAARGIIHLVVNDIVDSTQNLFPVDLPGATTPNLSDKRVVSLFTRTGTATTSELTPWELYRDLGFDLSTTPPTPTNTHNQFYYAERGKTE